MYAVTRGKLGRENTIMSAADKRDRLWCVYPVHLQSNICQTAILQWHMKALIFEIKWWVICWN